MQSYPGQKSLLPARMHAEFSEDMNYRYSLSRIWRPCGRLVNFVMLNPSTADEVNDDNTVRRCMKFADSWEYHGIIITNLFAWRATDPRMLKQVGDPIGPENNNYLLKYASLCDLVVCAWGNHGSYRGRDQDVINMLLCQVGIPLSCLELSISGNPKHPLRLNGNLQPMLWWLFT